MSETKTNELTRRRLLQGGAVLAASSLLPKAAHAQTYTQPNPATQPCPPYGCATLCPEPGSVVFSAASSPTSIPAQFVGLSYEKGQIFSSTYYQIFKGSNTSLQNMFALLSPNAGGNLRLGGASADEGTYTYNITTTTIANLAAFLAGIPSSKKWSCIYGINLKGQYLPNTYKPGYTDTGLANQEASDANYYFRTAGLANPIIEMGNEPDVWGTEEMGGTYANATYNLGVYQNIWNTFLPSLPSGQAVAATAGGADDLVPAQWEQPFVADLGSTPLALLTHHFYISDGQASTAPTWEDLRDWNLGKLVNNAPAGQPANYGPPKTAPFNASNFNASTASVLQGISKSRNPVLPYRLAETNSYWSGGTAGVSDAFVSALWVIDYLFAAAVGGASGVNFHTSSQAFYSALFEYNGAVSVVNPLFHGLKFFNMALDPTAGTGTMLAAAPGDFYGENVSCYAIQTSSNTTTVLLINKSGEYFFQPKITVPNVYKSATLIALTTTGSAGLQSRNWDGSNYDNYIQSTQIQGAAIQANGTWTPDPASLYTLSTPTNNGNNTCSVTCYLPSISAVLITFSS